MRMGIAGTSSWNIAVRSIGGFEKINVFLAILKSTLMVISPFLFLFWFQGKYFICRISL